jgi:hypothetical protein
VRVAKPKKMAEQSSGKSNWGQDLKYFGLVVLAVGIGVTVGNYLTQVAAKMLMKKNDTPAA